MSRIHPTNGSASTRSTRVVALAIAAGVLATASLARADGDHSLVPPRLQKKDHFVRDAISRMAYARPYELQLFETCDCIDQPCEGGLMLSCSGEVDPPFAGILTAVRRTSQETCHVCGCADYATLRATPVCID